MADQAPVGRDNTGIHARAALVCVVKLPRRRDIRNQICQLETSSLCIGKPVALAGNELHVTATNVVGPMMFSMRGRSMTVMIKFWYRSTAGCATRSPARVRVLVVEVRAGHQSTSRAL